MVKSKKKPVVPVVELHPVLVPLGVGESIVESDSVWQQRKEQEFATRTDQMLALPPAKAGWPWARGMNGE